ncbi:MurR/RpiR family transcriptional regulator [Caniella muris]|uniref:MurR/RpiR family transcriptional regulator n=1 Tax=Caniella muris TaxID=2941502 RepID=UPI00203D1560|nr:MurR/RpiR family transcriptional regulator [Caniella muris]
MRHRAIVEEAACDVGENLIARILSSRHTMSEGERRIADYLIAHQASVGAISQADLARQCQVSAPTVSRFCRKMGESDYRSFQMSFVRIQMTLHGLRDEQQHGYASIDNVGATVASLLDRRVAALTLTLEGLDERELEAAARTLAKARIVEFAAAGRSIPTAEDAAYRFERIGISAPTSPYYEKLISCALTLGPDDALVVFSRSGWSGTLQQVAGAAHDRGASVVTVTGNRDNPLARLSDHVFCVTSVDVAENDFTGNTRIGEVAIMEALFALVAAAKGDARACQNEHRRYIFSKVDLP